MNNVLDSNQNTMALPAAAEQVINELVSAAKNAFKEDLCSIVLFGSAAEGRLRATSDLNIMMVLKRFDRSRIDPLRDSLRIAHAAAKASVMFVLESELGAASEAFAVKFADISRRHRVLYGEDVVSKITPSREAKRRRLQQILVNLTLRLRERYALVSLREEQLAMVIAEAAGPLRAAAATLLELEGKPVQSPRAALQAMAADLGGTGWKEMFEHISQARETRSLPAGTAASTLFCLLDIAEKMRLRAERLT